jgi:hypothetical protein
MIVFSSNGVHYWPVHLLGHLAPASEVAGRPITIVKRAWSADSKMVR